LEWKLTAKVEFEGIETAEVDEHEATPRATTIA
jgi:hypothetical protein